jgi:hypothetical protein
VSAVADGLDDDQLLAALKDALSARHAVPHEFIESAKNAFAWHNIDAELAQLTYDSTSALESVAMATRSDTAAIRELTFSSPRLTIELEVSEDSLLGQVIPAQAATIDIQNRTGAERTVPADDVGFFSISPLPEGIFRLRCRAPGIDVVTGWVTL